MTRISTANGRVFRFERGLGPRNPVWGEVRKGGRAPLRGDLARAREILAALDAAEARACRKDRA